MSIQTAIFSPFGPLILESDGQALTALYPAPDSCSIRTSHPLFEAVTDWLALYWAGQNPGPVPVPLKPEGTPFQQQVWELLQQIPWGSTCSYGDLARQLTQDRGLAQMSAQAVGGAVGRNPIAILIPCHRVLGSRGQLTGYAYGLPMKKALLSLEGHSFP